MAEQEKNVFVVEDDSVELEGLRKALSKEFIVHEARHMADARSILAEKKDYALFIIDVILPYSKKDADLVQELEDQRMKLMRGTDGDTAADGTIAPKSTVEVRNAYAMLDLDEQIQELQDERGGVVLIREYCDGLAPNSKPPLRCPVPTLFLTAREFPILEKEALSLIEKGKGRWLVKPQKLKDIRRAIDEIMKGSAIS